MQQKELENCKVAETGLLMETIKSAIEQHYKTESANKDQFENELTGFLYENYKMSDKRIMAIVNTAVKIRNEHILDLAEYIEDFVNNLYQRYEEGLCPQCQPSYYKNSAVSIEQSNNFSCKWWEQMYNLFKGYVKTNKKKCVQAFKDKGADELLSQRDAEKLPEYAGILNDNTVLIDVDDYDQSEILMKIVEDKQLACRVYQTKRGKHIRPIRGVTDKHTL